MLRRLITLFAVSALIGPSLALFPVTAHAETIDHAALTAGVETTLNLAAGSTATFDIEIPPQTHPTIIASSVTRGAIVQVTQAQLFGVHWGNFLGDDPTTWYADLETNTGGDPLADTLQFQVWGADATMTFTLGYAGDQKREVTAGTAVPLTFAHPGERRLLSFDAGLQDTVTVHVTDVSLASAGPRDPEVPAFTAYYSYAFADDGPPLVETSPGAYEPLTLGGDGPLTLAIDPSFDRVGTLTVTIEITPGTLGALSYGQATEVTLDRPSRVRRYSLTTQASAPTLIRAFLPELKKADGTPGTAAFELSLPASDTPVVSGTISDQTIVTVPAGTLPDGVDAVLKVTSDAATTGTVTVSVQIDPGPSTPLTVGTSSPISLLAGATTSRYSISAQQGQDFEIPLEDITFTEPGFLGSVNVTFESPFGFADYRGPTQLTVFDGRLVAGFTATVTGTWTLVLSRPDEYTGVGVTLRALPLVLQIMSETRTLPLDERIALTKPAELLEVHVPVHAGHRIVVRLTDPTWTGPADKYGTPPSARPELMGGDILPASPEAEWRGSTDGDIYVESAPAYAAGEVVIRIVASDALVIGTARLVAYEPQDTSGVLRAEGVPTSVPLRQSGAIARYSFQATTGQPFALDIPKVTLSSMAQEERTRVTVRHPDGCQFEGWVLTGRQGWIDVAGDCDTWPVPSTPRIGTYTVEVDPSGDATGTVALTRTHAKVRTGPIRSGQQRTLTFKRGDVHQLTFTAAAGQRPVLRFTNQTISTGVELIDPSGETEGKSSDSNDLRYQEFNLLPPGGTWKLKLDPSGPAAGSLTVRLDLVTDPIRTITPEQVVHATWSVGQNPVFRVAVKKGQRLTVDIRSMDLASPGSVGVAIRHPSGEYIGGGVVGTPGWGGEAPPLLVQPWSVATEDGIWSVRVDPYFAVTGSLSFVVRTATDQAATSKTI